MEVKQKRRRLHRVAASGVLLSGSVFMLWACGATRSSAPQPESMPRLSGMRITMEDLHRGGGVPPGWRLTLPPGDIRAGHQAFVDFGCYTCHAVQGGEFPDVPAGQGGVGPDLTGMGSHHPAAYFAESILNPNAVLVDGPGYLGRDGRSIMPAYPDMTLAQLGNLVAYLRSLTTGVSDLHVHRVPGGPEGQASSFFVQAYTLKLDELAGFYDWFEKERFRDYEGLVSVTTYAGRDRSGCVMGTGCTEGVGADKSDVVVVSVFGFEDEGALGRFLKHLPAAGAGGKATGDLVHPADQYMLRTPAVYKPIGLSVP